MARMDKSLMRSLTKKEHDMNTPRTTEINDNACDTKRGGCCGGSCGGKSSWLMLFAAVAVIVAAAWLVF